MTAATTDATAATTATDRRSRLGSVLGRFGGIDPVVEREARERMRSRPAGTLTLYLAIVLLVAWMVHGTTSTDGADPTGLGRPMFEWVLGAQFLAMLLIVPATLAGAISGERERDTLVPLQVTLLRPWRIVTGKLVAGLAYMLLLMVASLPIVSLSFLLGGVSVTQVAMGTAAVAFVGVVLASLSIACSARARRTQTATVQVVLLVLVLMVGPHLAGVVWSVATDDTDDEPPLVMTLPEPALFVAAVAGGEREAFGGGDSGPFTALVGLVDDLMEPDSAAVEIPTSATVMTLDDGRFEVGPVVDETAAADDPPRLRLHPRRDYALMSGGLLASLAALALVLATRWVRTPSRSDR